MAVATDRAVLKFRGVVLAVFVAAIAAGMLLPLYTDEIGWRLHERAGFDGVDKLFTRICGPNTVATPPFWMMPVRYYSYLFNSLFADPFYVRVSGVGYALAWTALVLTLICRIAESALHRAVLSILAIGLMSLGVMPLLLVWSRPEQPILLALTGAMVIASAGRATLPQDTPVRTAWLRSLAITALALIAVSYHVKALFVVPAMLACIAFAARGRRAWAPRAVAAAIVVIASAWGARYWVSRLACPDDPAVLASFAKQNAAVGLVREHGIGQVLAFAAKAAGNIEIVEYFGMALPRPNMMSNWVPSLQVSPSLAVVWFLVARGVWLLVLLLALAGLVLAAREAWRTRRLEPRSTLAVLLAAGMVGWSATQGVRNVYEASFVVPIAMLAAVLLIATIRTDLKLFGSIKRAGIAIGALGLVSVAAVTAIYGPGLVRTASESGYVKRQDFSVSAFGYDRLKPDILAAARACGIPSGKGGSGVLVDDVTYFALMQSHMPEHRQGLFEKRYVDSLTETVFAHADRDPIAYLRGIGSRGIVISCSGFPPEYQSRVKRRGDFCCLGPPQW